MTGAKTSRKVSELAFGVMIVSSHWTKCEQEEQEAGMMRGERQMWYQ